MTDERPSDNRPPQPFVPPAAPVPPSSQGRPGPVGDPFAPTPPTGYGAPRWNPPPYGPPRATAVAEPPRAGRRATLGKPLVAGLLVAALTMGGLAGAVGGIAAGSGTIPFAATVDDSVTTATVTSGTDDDAPEGSTEAVAAAVLPSVVKINVSSQQGEASGSGIILSSDGEILTNNHVVTGVGDGARLTVSLDDGTTVPAEVVGTDPVTDLAVIRAQDVSDLTPASIATDDVVDVGEDVVAIGSPFGLEATVTDGIVSALNRPVSVGGETGTDETTYPAIQTDAAINPGNSGGPLVNLAGEVVGVNSSIRSGGTSGEGGSIGLGFAIPMSKVWPVVEQLRAGETPTHAQLGVSVGDVTSDDGLVTGAQVQSVEPGSAADEAGLQEGDVVTKLDDVTVSGSESLVATVRGERPDQTVTLTYLRDGDEQTADVTLDSDAQTTAS
ncbi:trypsin-like peptidase domain-containing protein [uncultured Nocardioides sp.]|uniref:S1C family serine protease n=1 Tax=uncultured Nocardioides sp. TaxID=198441 RepID=UPI00260F62F5|nr:trypsin-like peptidase domain-containing protein [uncultured Nocardioides sp.]